jgi:hypothetical protein
LGPPKVLSKWLFTTDFFKFLSVDPITGETIYSILFKWGQLLTFMPLYLIISQNHIHPLCCSQKKEWEKNCCFQFVWTLKSNNRCRSKISLSFSISCFHLSHSSSLILCRFFGYELRRFRRCSKDFPMLLFRNGEWFLIFSILNYCFY